MTSQTYYGVQAFENGEGENSHSARVHFAHTSLIKATTLPTIAIWSSANS
jgi:hypothetical protein